MRERGVGRGGHGGRSKRVHGAFWRRKSSRGSTKVVGSGLELGFVVAVRIGGLEQSPEFG